MIDRDRIRVIDVIVLVLAILGIAVSVELTEIHVLTHTDPEFHSVCAVSEGVNCETVALSPYSVFSGLPVSVWGIIGYLFLAAFAMSGMTKRRLHDIWPYGGLLALSVVYFSTSIVLAYISFTRIDSICLFCMTSYVINFALFVLSSITLYRRRLNPIKALAADVRAVMVKPLRFTTVFAIASVAVGATMVSVEPYWGTLGWDDMPELPSGTDENGLHWIGAETPKITIVEFSDYECPHCRKAHKKTRMLAAQRPKEIRLYHRHLPLDKACHPGIKREFHHYACHFAKAAECAGDEGRFWEMNDALFSIQDKIKSKDVNVEILAVQIGLDRSAFKKCMASERPMAAIQADLETAMKKALHGTPTYFIGDQKFVGQVPETAFDALLDAHETEPRISQN